MSEVTLDVMTFTELKFTLEKWSKDKFDNGLLIEIVYVLVSRYPEFRILFVFAKVIFFPF